MDEKPQLFIYVMDKDTIRINGVTADTEEAIVLRSDVLLRNGSGTFSTGNIWKWTTQIRMHLALSERYGSGTVELQIDPKQCWNKFSVSSIIDEDKVIRDLDNQDIQELLFCKNNLLRRAVCKYYRDKQSNQ